MVEFFRRGLAAGLLGLVLGYAAAYAGYLTLPEESRSKLSARFQVGLSQAGYPVRVDAEQEKVARIPMTNEENQHMALFIIAGIAVALGATHFLIKRRKS